jgi:hypothetical protein
MHILSGPAPSPSPDVNGRVEGVPTRRRDGLRLYITFNEINVKKLKTISYTLKKIMLSVENIILLVGLRIRILGIFMLGNKI